MKTALKTVKPSAKTPHALSKSAGQSIQARASQELVIALSGPVGCGAPHVRESLTRTLAGRGYKVVPVKVSGLLASLNKEIAGGVEGSSYGSEFERINGLQEIGNSLRNLFGDDVGAQLAIKSIAIDRTASQPGKAIGEIEPARVVYLIDQLKHPKEALLLRNIYGNMFYTVGVLCGYARRKKNLVALGVSPQNAEVLMEKDRKESDDNGQQLEKTLKLADFFLRNSHHNTQILDQAIERFVGLIHGDNGLTPTRQEYGMYSAYVASLKSACLSRQVGASIVDHFGNVISIGCNDVPRAGGGLYEAGQVGQDHRCIFLEGGKCFNDKEKDRVKEQISDILKSNGVDSKEARRLATAIRKESRLKDLIEFSRAVHAEMDAIVRVARCGGQSVSGAFMFATTYPCHNCARHIVASGIRAVYFIEPYEKSMAVTLHDDSIDHEPDEEPKWEELQASSKVAFLHFEGVAPNRFSEFFYAQTDRKDSGGRAIKVSIGLSQKKAPEYLDNYRELEALVIKRLEAIKETA